LTAEDVKADAHAAPMEGPSDGPQVQEEVKEEETESDDDDVGANDLYDEPVHMNEIGDRDEIRQILEIVREAIMKSGGDEWTTQEFQDAYPETNVAKAHTYRRVEYPLDRGKVQNHPNKW
jgi:hypothetical protein